MRAADLFMPSNEWTLLAEIDESGGYEVDITAIYQKPDGGFVLALASGCSCWDGEYDMEDFDSLDDIAASFRDQRTDSRRWLTTWKGADQLMAEARAAMEGTR